MTYLPNFNTDTKIFLELTKIFFLIKICTYQKFFLTYQIKIINIPNFKTYQKI